VERRQPAPRAGAGRGGPDAAGAGLAAYERRVEAGYSYERAAPAFSAEHEARFRADPGAWVFWEAQPPGYRRLNTFRVVSAKREETRHMRLERLIEACVRGERLA